MNLSNLNEWFYLMVSMNERIPKNYVNTDRSIPLDCGDDLKEIDCHKIRAIQWLQKRALVHSFIEGPFHQNEIAVPIQFTYSEKDVLVYYKHSTNRFWQIDSSRKLFWLFYCTKIFCACVKGEITTVKLPKLSTILSFYLS